MPEILPPEADPSASRRVWSTTWRLLTFRASTDELVQLNRGHLLFGLVCTWVVGIGRYWDNPRVNLLQHSGIGSIIYVFALATLLWLIMWPLKPRHWSYFRVLTFVTLVSPPAILYAIPVEKFYSIDTANTVNLWFLAIVALWRVALLWFFLRRLGAMSWPTIFVAATLPLNLIVVTLTVLNLDQVVFNIMGGITERTPNDFSFGFLVQLSFISIVMFPFLLICYLAIAAHSLVESRRQARIRGELKHEY